MRPPPWPRLPATCLADSRLSDHLVEQPKTFVLSTGTGLPAKQGLDGVAGIVGRGSLGLLGVVDPARESQLPLAVEDEHVRGGHGAVRPGDLLVLAVVKVGETEAALLGPDLQVLEAVAQVAVAQFVQPHRLRDRWARWPPGRTFLSL